MNLLARYVRASLWALVMACQKVTVTLGVPKAAIPKANPTRSKVNANFRITTHLRLSFL